MNECATPPVLVEEYPYGNKPAVEDELGRAEVIAPPWETPAAPSFSQFVQSSRKRMPSRWGRLAGQETVVLGRDSSADDFDMESASGPDGIGPSEINGRASTRPATQ